MNPQLYSLSSLLSYTIEHKNLPEKRRFFWQAGERADIRFPVPKGASGFESYGIAKAVPDTKAAFFLGA